jgi:hypothetical protein
MSEPPLTKTGSILHYIFEKRGAGWLAFGVVAVLFVLLFLAQLAGMNPARLVTRGFFGAVWENQSESETKPVDNDPLGIVGAWTYTTSFDSVTDSKKHKYKEVQGVNFLIKFEGCSYAMQGQRTHYMEKNSSIFQKYPNPITIKISRTGFTSDHTSFFFFFEVQGDDQSSGFVELQIEKSNKSSMDGVVHYLHNDRTWSKALIHFQKQNS